MSGRVSPAEILPDVGLALAGGGPEGAVYEIGALRAIDEVIDGLSLNRLGVYVGVSAGSFIASCLANQLSTAQMCRAIVKTDPGEHPFNPETFLQPAFGELVRRGVMTPRLAVDALRDYLFHPGDLSLVSAMTRLGRALPVGVFNNEPIRAYLEKIFTMKGRTDDFRELDQRLYVVAADLESGMPVRFGEPGFDHMPISTAVQASTALPGLYPPVRIERRYYVDGVLLKTLHASAALDAGAKLLICINPIVPVNLLGEGRDSGLPTGYLIQRGLPTVLSQTFRTLIHSRLVVGLARYATTYRGADVLLLEPEAGDFRMFFTNIFAFSSRKAVCEHAYLATRRELWRRREVIGPVLERHGLRLRLEILAEDRDLWKTVGLPHGSHRPVTLNRLDHALERLEALLAE